MSGGTVTLGVFNDMGPGGFTSFTKDSNTIITYVDPLTGDDANSGDYDAPVETIEEGVTRLRPNQPDWLLLRQNRTFTITNASTFNPWNGHNSSTDRLQLKHGVSENAPTLVSTYGPGADEANPFGTSAEPPPEVDFASSGVVQLIPLANYMALVGITFRYRERDFRDPLYDAGAPASSAIGSGGTRDWILVEDCAFIGNGNGLQDTAGEVRVRRCKTVAAPGLGLYLQGNLYNLQEENFYWHSGWIPASMGGARSGGVHNVYGQIDNGVDAQWITRGCMSGWGSYNGQKQRHGGLATKNVCWQCQQFLDIGTSNLAVVQGLGSTPNEYTYNIVVDAAGSGIGVSNTGLPVLIERNLFINQSVSGACIALDAVSHDVTVRDNIAINFAAPSNLGTDNDVEAPISSTEGMIDPTRDIASYIDHLGFDTEEELVTAIEENRKWNWDQTYTDVEMRAYFEQGYSVNYQRLAISCAP
jgi:hypothetical protein